MAIIVITLSQEAAAPLVRPIFVSIALNHTRNRESHVNADYTAMLRVGVLIVQIVVLESRARTVETTAAAGFVLALLRDKLFRQ